MFLWLPVSWFLPYLKWFSMASAGCSISRISTVPRRLAKRVVSNVSIQDSAVSPPMWWWAMDGTKKSRRNRWVQRRMHFLDWQSALLFSLAWMAILACERTSEFNSIDSCLGMAISLKTTVRCLLFFSSPFHLYYCLVLSFLAFLFSCLCSHSCLFVCLFFSLGKSTFTHSDLHEVCATSINHNLMRAHLSMYTYILCLLSLFVCISYLYEYEYWTRKETFIVEILRFVLRTFRRCREKDN